MLEGKKRSLGKLFLGCLKRKLLLCQLKMCFKFGLQLLMYISIIGQETDGGMKGMRIKEHRALWDN